MIRNRQTRRRTHMQLRRLEDRTVPSAGACPPEAADDIFATDEDTALSGLDLFADNGNGADIDDDGDAIFVGAVDGSASRVGTPFVLPSGAVLSVSPDGSAAYDPNGAFDYLPVGEAATDTFTYTISDGTATDTATVTVTLDGRFDTIITLDDAAETDEGSPITVAVPGVLANDAPTADVGRPPAPAAVDFTFVDNGGSTTYNLQAGESLLIESGTFTGSVTLPAGATVAVAGGATFAPAAVNNAAGTVRNFGTADFPGVALAGGFRFENNGRAAFTGNVNFNGPAGLENSAYGRLSFVDSFTLANGSSMTNLGVAVMDSTFSTNLGTDLTNYGRVTTRDNFNPEGAVHNFGTVYAEGFININTNSEVVNRCAFVAQEGFNNNSDNTQNFGVIYITDGGATWQNNASFFNAPGATVVGSDFLNNSAITGGGDFFFGGQTRNAGPFGIDADADPINFFDATPTAGQVFDIQDQAPAGTTAVSFTPPTLIEAQAVCQSAPTPNQFLIVVELNGEAADVGPTVTLPSGALVTIQQDGSYVYDPNGQFDGLGAGETATDSFEYTAEDQAGATGVAVVTVTINGINEPPVAADDLFDVEADEALTGVNVITNPAGGDTDPNGDTLTVTEVGGAAGGVGSPAGGSAGGRFTITATGDLSFDPAGDFDDLGPGESRDTTVTYTVSDGNGGSDTATVTVTVTGPNDQANLPPVAVDDNAAAGEGGPAVTIDVLANDFDPEGGPVEVVGFDDAGTLGTVALNADDTFDYDPAGQFESLAAGETATETFAYTIEDDSGQQSTATVTVVVNGSNDAPAFVGPADGSVPEGAAAGTPVAAVSADDIDVSDTLTFAITAGNGDAAFAIDPQSGAVTVNDPAALNFEDRSEAVLTVTVSDGNGGSDTVAVTVELTNVAPSVPADADGTANVVQEGAAPGEPTGLTASSIDPNGTAGGGGVVYSLADDAGGRFAINPASGEVTVGPQAGLIDADEGPYEVTVLAEDGAGGSSTATFAVAVGEPPDDEPDPIDDVVLMAGTDCGPHDGAVSLGGGGHGSAFRSLMIVLDEAELPADIDDMMPDAGELGVSLIKLSGPGGTGPIGLDVADSRVNEETGLREVVLTFSGPGTLFGGLADGHYSLNFGVAGGGEAPLLESGPGGVSSLEFTRLFGDSDGDADVDKDDLNAFRAAYRSQVPSDKYRAQFDFDGDCDVDGADYREFRKRYRTGL